MRRFSTLIVLIIGLVLMMNVSYQLGHDPVFANNIPLSLSVAIVVITLVTFVTYLMSTKASESSGLVIGEAWTLIAFGVAYFSQLGIAVIIGGMFLIAGIFFYSFEYKEIINVTTEKS